MRKGIFILLLSVIINSSQCLNILVIYESIASSHFGTFEYFFKTLTAKGHSITVISFFPQVRPLSNYTDVSLQGLQSFPDVRVSELDQIRSPRIEMYGTPHFIAEIGHMSCEVLLTHPDVRKIVEKNNTYDVILREVFYTNCHNGLAKKFKAPVIGKQILFIKLFL